MGSALGGCLIALAAPGAPLLAPTVWQDFGASGRVVQSGCYPVALITQPQSEGLGSSGSGVPGSLISTCSDRSTPSCTLSVSVLCRIVMLLEVFVYTINYIF